MLYYIYLCSLFCRIATTMKGKIVQVVNKAFQSLYYCFQKLIIYDKKINKFVNCNIGVQI